MAVHTDFLLASRERLLRAFAGWGTPLATPRRVPGRNPATGAAVEWRDWTDPGDPPSDATTPPDLSGLHVLALKGVDPVKIARLARAAAIDDMALFEQELFAPARVAPPEHEGSLHAVPDRLVDVLARLDGAAVHALGRTWSVAARADIASIPDPSVRARELAIWTEDVLCELAAQLAELARLRGIDERLYLFVTY